MTNKKIVNTTSKIIEKRREILLKKWKPTMLWKLQTPIPQTRKTRKMKTIKKVGAPSMG
jgi:hypothetical protein